MFGGHWPLVPIGHTLPCPATGQSPLTHTLPWVTQKWKLCIHELLVFWLLHDKREKVPNMQFKDWVLQDIETVRYSSNSLVTIILIDQCDMT